MKFVNNNKIGILNLTVMIFFLTLVFVFNSCQDVNAPNVEIQSVKISIQVTDMEGNPLSGIGVNYKERSSPSTTLFQPFGIGTTPSNLPPILGIINKNMNIPINGVFNTFQLSVPTNYSLQKGANLEFNNVFFPCHDTLIIFRLPIVVEVPCGQTLSPITMKTITLCQNEKQFDTICTNQFSINCQVDNEITVSDFSVITGAKMIIKLSSGVIVSSPPPFIFTLPAGQSFTICMAYDNKKTSQAYQSETINVKAKPVGVTGSQYNLVDINFSAESKCQDCICPTQDFVINFPTKDKQKLCINEKANLFVDLKGFTNTNKNCLMRLSLEKGFSNSNFKLVNFNNNSLELEPNTSLSNLEFEALSTSFGDFSEELIYGITLINKADLSETNCNSKIKVKFNFSTDGATCSFDSLSNLFTQPFSSDQSTKTFFSAIDYANTNGTNSKRITLRNTNAECPLVITDMFFENLSGVKQTNPFYFANTTSMPIVIPPSGSKDIDILFNPKLTDVYPPDGKRTNTKVDVFNQKLVVVTNSPNCKLNQIPLNGQIESNSSLNPCLEDWKLQNNGVFVENDQLTFRSSPSHDLAFYFESVNFQTQTAILKKGFASDGNRYVDFHDLGDRIMVVPEKNACDLVSKYPNVCDLTNPVEDRITVKPGRLIVIKYIYGGKQFCALMSIGNIINTGTSSAENLSVCYSICPGI